jgi:heparanase
MMGRKLIAGSALALVLSACATTPSSDGLGLSSLAKLGTVNERFQSYNIEMVEVTGGRFWAPYGGPEGEVYRERPPIDLSNARLRNMAKNLAPAMMRVSGTWANNTYLEAEGETLAEPPTGYKQTLTRDQWRGVVSFSKAVGAPIVTSFAVSSGTRGPDGVWKTEQAQRIVDLTKQAGGSLFAAEFFNEPNVPSATIGMPADYDAVRYGTEFRMFKDWARRAVPEMKIIGPGGVGEGGLLKNMPVNALGEHVATEDMMKQNPNSVDAVSYHFYGSVSQRCTFLNIGTAVKENALKPEWLDRTLVDFDVYSGLRNRYEAGKELWNTETAQAACGGSPWASTFLDSFRYLNQNATLAQKGVQVVMHNTLAASDYALIDRDTIMPRPNYWAAVLWSRLMDRTVLASPASPSPDMRLYAHCTRGQKGGVTMMALNLGSSAQSLAVGNNAKSWVMTGAPIDTKTVSINGQAPNMAPDGTISGLDGARVSGAVSVPGQSIAFVAVADANNTACR